MTKLIKLASNNVVLHVGDDLTLDATAARGAGWQDFNTTTANAELVAGTPPSTWVGGAYAFDGQNWTIVNQALIRVPQSVSRFQAFAALSNAGLLAAAQTAVASASQIVQLAWGNAQDFERDSPTIAAIAQSLTTPLTSSQVDALFIAAVQIKA
ncbi:hypothetical protein [Telmatospirillum sp.]|uniref:hypothetical protein n=1 Tax=Telmatospirillum sp. TaxID=2079197 RepID=UPI002843F3AC|nr:hypothetical protein [Telmatospirillum sp.]MDR3439880.1 hypothetical protein [Telmatospirillum sp.]